MPIIKLHGRGDLTAAERVAVVQGRLEQVLARATGPPDVTVVMVEERPVIRAEDLAILTVTDRDAAYEGKSKAQTAILWRSKLEHGLASAWRFRSGAYFWKAVVICVTLLALGIVLHLLIGRFARRRLSVPGAAPQALLWMTLAVAILWQFPSTRLLGDILKQYLALPFLKILGVLVLGILARMASTAYLDHFFRTVRALRCRESALSSRSVQRLEMARQAVQVAADGVVVVVVAMSLLTVLHINPGTLLASAGLIGVALGVATQDPAKDLTNGFAILLEDHFGVGDVIRVAGVEGEVVVFTLRSTQIRTAEGSLVTLPNAVVRGVENRSNEWAQVDLCLTIRYAPEDVARGLALMEQAGLGLREAHPEMVAGKPIMLGLDALTHEGAVLRMWLKTTPYRQSEVRRLLLARTAELFFHEGIEMPVPRKSAPASPPPS